VSRRVRRCELPTATSDQALLLTRATVDEWSEMRQQILDADIFVLGTPIWMGHPSGHAQRVLESLDASLGETDPDGRMVSVER
jgi:multimeric flavodoxin WrbA